MHLVAASSAALSRRFLTPDCRFLCTLPLLYLRFLALSRPFPRSWLLVLLLLLLATFSAAWDCRLLCSWLPPSGLSTSFAALGHPSPPGPAPPGSILPPSMLPGVAAVFAALAATFVAATAFSLPRCPGRRFLCYSWPPLFATPVTTPSAFGHNFLCP